MKWRKIAIIITLSLLSFVVGSIFLFRWSAGKVVNNCRPNATFSEVLTKIDAFNSDLSPFQQLTLSEDDLTLMLRQSLSENTCVRIEGSSLYISIPNNWLAYQLTVQPQTQAPFWFVDKFSVNKVSMPAGVVEQFNRQIQKAWRDFSYDLTAKRILTRITVQDKQVILEGEIPPPPN